MVNDIVGYIIILGSAVLLSFLIDFRNSLSKWFLLFLFLIVGAFDNLSHTLTTTYPGIQLIETNVWDNYLVCNWSAKLYSIVFALVILYLVKDLTRDDIGLRLKQKKNSQRFSLYFLLFFLFAGIVVGLMGKKGVFDVKTLLYLAIMPGLNEELIYRGFLLGILDKIFDRRFKLFKTSFGWGAIISSAVFGLLHGFQLTDNFEIQIVNLPNVVLTGLFGFAFSLMKERSGSLVFPIISHSVIDFFHFLVRMI